MACNCFQIDNAAPRGTALSRAWIGKGCCTSASALYTWLAGRAPFFYKNGCGGVKNVKGTTTLSVHSEGRAFDVSLRDPNHPWQRQFMWDRLNQMVEHGCILGLQRIIFNGRIWDMSMGFSVTGPSGWRRFTGSQNHNDHAHVEVCRMSCTRVNADIVNYVLGIRTPAPSETIGSPGSSAGNNSGGGSAGTPPAVVAPVAPTPPVVTSNAPVWIDTSICGQCGLTGFTSEDILQEEIVAVRLVCGGAGGYCIDKRSGTWCGSGLVRDWGQTGGSFGGAVVDVQTYGLDLYALVNVGTTQTVRQVSRNILTVHPLPNCGAFNGPWSRMTVANNGKILLSNSEDGGGGYQMCGFDVPLLWGSQCCGATTRPARVPVVPNYPTDESVLLYHTCDFALTDSTPGIMPNYGSAGSAYNLPVDDDGPFITAYLNTTIASLGIDWDALGGLPTAAPFTFVVAGTAAPNNAGNCTIWLGSNTSGVDYRGVGMYGYTVATSPRDGVLMEDAFYSTVDAGFTLSYNSTLIIPNHVFFVEVDYVTQTINIWNGLTLVGTYTAGAPFVTSIDTDLGSNPFGEGVEIGFSYINPDDEPTAPWPHKGMAMLRKALTEEERAEWIAYDWCADDTIASTAILLYDTRLWTEGDPVLENLGSAGAIYDMPIVSDGDWTNYYGLQDNDYYAELATSGGIGWPFLGGTPDVGGVITFIIATGNTADGAGWGLISFDASTPGNQLDAAVENYDGTISGPEAVFYAGDPMQTVSPGLSTFGSNGTETNDAVFFFEVDLTGTPYMEIRQGETVVDSDTRSAYGAGAVNAIYSPGDGVTFRIVGADTGWPAGAPWRMRGMAMVRGVLDAAGRAAWQDYFLD